MKFADILIGHLPSKRELKRAVGSGLIGLLTASFLIGNLSNIGGQIVLALAAPKVAIDATTRHSVQPPLKFDYESRGFSWFHPGADLVARTGTAVSPIMAGRVAAARTQYWGLGKHVVVSHDGAYESTYAHLSKIDVQEGQEVTLDSKLGKVGSTGFSTGAHLHLEIRQKGTPVNPADVVPGVK